MNASLFTSTATLGITNVNPSTWSTSAQQIASDPLQGQWLPFGPVTASPQTGALRLDVPLDLRQSPPNSMPGNYEIAAGNYALVYNSETVNAKPIVEASFASESAVGVPTSIDAQLTWNNGTPQSVVSFSTSGHSAGDTYLISTQVASAVTSSGRYPWTMTVTAHFSSRGDVLRTVSGYAFVAVEDTTNGLGHGWTLAGADHLVTSNDGAMWVYGNGDTRFFSGNTGSAHQPRQRFRHA